MLDFRDYIVEVIDSDGIVLADNQTAVEIVEIVESGPQGIPGNPGLVLLQATDPVPSPVLDGVLYLRLTS